MTKFLLSLHVVAAVVAIGPVTVAASMFPRYVRTAFADPTDVQPVTVLATLHRICRVYALVGITVPVFGFATAVSLDALGDAWLIASVALTGVAAVVLAVAVLPGQRAAIELVDGRGEAAGSGTASVALATQPSTGRRVSARLAMTAGIFNLLWTVVVVLMIVRPGSTTGA